MGNALEVIEAVEMLRGQAPDDYTEVTLALTAEMLVLGGKAATTRRRRASGCSARWPTGARCGS